MVILFGVGKKISAGKWLAILFVIVLVFHIFPMASADSWPMFLYNPEHTGNTTSAGSNYNYTIWSKPLVGGNGYSSPAVANGRVFVNRGGAGVLYCLYENNGTEIWNQNIGSDGQRSSTPAVAEGKVYVVGSQLYCFYENNGTELWSKSLSGGGVGTSSPTVTDGKVFVNTQTLYCFYADNGTEIWSKQVDGSQYSSTPAVANQKVFVNAEKLYCFYVNNGTEVWNVTGGGFGNSPTVANGKVYFNPSQLRCLYENNGTEIWNKPAAGDAYSSPAVTNGRIYVHTNDRVKCYYENNGTNIWSVLVEEGRGCSSPAVSADGKVFVIGWNGNDGGVTYCLNGSSGAVMWKYITGGAGYSSCAIANDKVFVNDGTVYCFGPPPYTADYILIRDGYGGGGINLCDPLNYPSYPVGLTTTFYGAFYNYSAPGDGFVFDVPVISSWVSNETDIVDVTTPGSFSTISCSFTNSGIVTIILNDGEGHENTTQVTVLDPTVDYIQIRDAPGGGGLDLCNSLNYPTYPVGTSTTYYGAAYNSTTGYIGDVNRSSIWDSSDPTIINVSSPGPMSSISSNATKWGTITITLDNGDGNTNTTLVTVLDPTVDYIIIMTGPGGTGSWIDDLTFMFGSSTTFYAVGYNDSAGFVEDVDAMWSSDNPIVGNVNPGPSNSTTFFATNNGTCNITADYGGYSNTTGVLTVFNYTVDYIIIRDSPNGGGQWIGNKNFNVGESATFYAAVYNISAPGDGYIGDFEVTWECSDTQVASVTSPASSTLFNTQFIGGECVVTARYGPFISNATGILTVLTSELDFIVITDTPNGNERINVILDVGESITIFASGYNNTGPTYIGLVEINWTQSPTSIGTFSRIQGNSTIFTAGMMGGTTTITAIGSDPYFSDNFVIDINEPEVDYIQIRDAANGRGNIVTSNTFNVYDEAQFYAAAYNLTSDYLYDVPVMWSSSDQNIGEVDPAGIWTNFSALRVDVDGACIVTALYSGNISDSTELLTVFAPRVDYIQIRDAPQGEGNITTTVDFLIGENLNLQYFCAAYNSSVLYLGDRSAKWTISNVTGTLSPENGISTNFTPTTTGLTVITANLTGVINSTGTINVYTDIIFDPIPKGLIVELGEEEGSLRLTWDPYIDPNLRGYNIYRSTDNSSGYELVNTQGPVIRTTFLDTGLVPDTTYYYAITWVDNSDNESPPSDTANNTPVAEEEEEDEFPILWLIILIFIIIELFIIVFFLYKRRKKPKVMTFEPTGIEEESLVDEKGEHPKDEDGLQSKENDEPMPNEEDKLPFEGEMVTGTVHLALGTNPPFEE
jgi:outer membrane protein assembly factor BamB